MLEITIKYIVTAISIQRMAAMWPVIIAMGWPTVMIIITINIIVEIREVISVNSTRNEAKKANAKGRTNNVIIFQNNNKTDDIIVESFGAEKEAKKEKEKTCAKRRRMEKYDESVREIRGLGDVE